MEHHEARTNLGAYVLGVLDPAERHAVERHLETCGICRDDLGQLSVVRSLLDRIDETDLAAPALDLRQQSEFAVSLARARASERRRIRVWQFTTVVAASLAIVALTSGFWGAGPTVASEPLALREVTTAAASARGVAAAMSWEWGTTVSLDLTSLPRREGYVVWVVAGDGRREQAGTWGPTERGGAKVRGASGIPSDQIARVEITDLDGSILLVFEPPRPTAQPHAPQTKAG